MRRRSSVNSTNTHWCAKVAWRRIRQMHADPCSTSAHSSHSHVQCHPALTLLARPLSAQIRLSQSHLPIIVALSNRSHYTFIPFVHPPIHHHAPHSQRPAHRHLKHLDTNQSPVAILQLAPRESHGCLPSTASHASLQAPVGRLLVLCLTAQAYHSLAYP
jgi:hypothetical protein